MCEAAGGTPAELPLPAWQHSDLPACLAVAGLLRMLHGEGEPVRMSWHPDRTVPSLWLPPGMTVDDVVEQLRFQAARRAESDDWALLEAVRDPDRWSAALDRAIHRRDLSAVETLAMGAAYELVPIRPHVAVWRGGSHPLVRVTKNMTLARWGQAAAQRAATLPHAAWRRKLTDPDGWTQTEGSWQGWRRYGDIVGSAPGADLAIVWLAIEGLWLWPVAVDPESHRAEDETERTTLVPGLVHQDGRWVWEYPAPEEPVDLAALTALARWPRRCRTTVFRLHQMDDQYRTRYWGYHSTEWPTVDVEDARLAAVAAHFERRVHDRQDVLPPIPAPCWWGLPL